MARGGYRAPKDKTPKPSGRTDHQKQALRLPNVTDSEDLQYGDRQRLEQSLRTTPLPQARSPRVAAPAPGTVTGGGGRALIDQIFGRPTDRAGEPPSEGAPFGAGGGPETLQTNQQQQMDEMDEVLRYVIEQTGDQGVVQMLDDHREFKAWRANRNVPLPAPAPARAMPEPMESEQPLVHQPSTGRGLEPVPVSEAGGEPSPSSPISEEDSMRPSDGQTPLL